MPDPLISSPHPGPGLVNWTVPAVDVPGLPGFPLHDHHMLPASTHQTGNDKPFANRLGHLSLGKRP